MKWILLLVFFSSVAQAITEEQLLNKYGKRKVANFISEKSKGKLTIFFNGELKKAHKPSPEYITPVTIRMDLNEIGYTSNKVDAYFEKILKDKKEKELRKRKILIELEEERKRKKEARKIEEEKERLRPKDKYDLAVAKAVNRGLELELQAEKEKRKTLERRRLLNERSRKNKNYSSKSNSRRGSNPVCKISLNKVTTDLKSVYSKKYPDSYSTQKMLIDSNIKSYKKLCRETVNNTGAYSGPS